LPATLPGTGRGDEEASMASFKLSVNMEFVRSADKPFEWGVAKAAELGYGYV
jgi:hypothetical protein